MAEFRRPRGRLGFDLDGVLYDWHEGVLDYFKDMGQVSPMTTVADLFAFPEEDGIIHHWSKWIKDYITHLPEFFEAPIDPRKLDIVRELGREYEIAYITARVPELEYFTKRWIVRNGLPQPENTYVTNGSKRNIVDGLELDYMIEDRPKYAVELADITTVILLTRPWNEKLPDDGYVRIDTLEELIPLLLGED